METFERLLLGSQALDRNFLSRDQLDEALKVQGEMASQGMRPPRLGEILISRGYLTDEQLRAILSAKRGGGGSLFGEIAETWGLCSSQDLIAAIGVQIEYRLSRRRPPRLGEILLSRGVLKPHQIHAVLKAQGKMVVQCPGCSTSYNALHVKEGLKIACPRCNTVFTPIPPPTETVVDGEPVTDVRSDVTAFLPAVEGEERRARDSARLPAMPLPSLPRYQMKARIGADSSGLLFLAHDASLQRAVAVRVISKDPQGAVGMEAWRQAALSAVKLVHPNLQRVLSADFDGARLAVATEFYEGQSLRLMLQRNGKLDVPAALSILVQVGEALTYGLSQEVVHGDLRPNRVLIDGQGQVRVCGLGMPKRIHDDLKLLTGNSGAAPLYAAPEVVHDAQDVTGRADVYSLCAIGYHMVTGRAPHIASLTHRGQIRIAPPTIMAPYSINPNIPPYVSRLLLKGLARNPEDRYVSVRELLEDLKTCRNAVRDSLRDVPAIAPAFTRPGGLRTPVSRVRSGGRTRRHRTAWRSVGGVRLTLADPPPPSQIQAALGDEDCDRRRSAGTCPAMAMPADARSWTWAHTAAVASIAVLLVAAAVVLLRPAPDVRNASATNNVAESAPTSSDGKDMVWLLQKDLEEQVLAYQRAHPDDFNGIRYRADLFVRTNGKDYAAAEPVRRARTIRLEQSRIGAAKSREALQKKIGELLEQDRFADALHEVTRWGAYWGKDAVGGEEEALSNHIRSEQRAHAQAWLTQGKTQRSEGAWDKARESFKKVETRLGSEFAEQAKREEALTDEAEQRSKSDLGEAVARKEAARVESQRDAAAPVLFRKLVSDLHVPIAELNFPQAWRILAEAEPALTGTSQALAFENVRSCIKRMEGLRDRAVRDAVAGRLNDFTLHVSDWDGQVVDATENGLEVKSGDVRAVVAWSKLSHPTLVALFERCTDFGNANEVMDLGLYRLYQGDLAEAEALLDRAEGLGAMVQHHRDLLPIMQWVVQVDAAQVPAEDRDRHLVQVAATRSMIRSMDWNISRGQWTVNPDNSMVGTPDQGLSLMSLSRELPKFQEIEVEVRGEGDAVGFSFGKGQRFMVRPISVWQKVSLHVLPGDLLELRVDGERRDSLEAVSSGPITLPAEVYLRGLGKRIEFRNFSIDGKAVRANLGPAAKAEGPVPAPKPNGVQALDAL